MNRKHIWLGILPLLAVAGCGGGGGGSVSLGGTGGGTGGGVGGQAANVPVFATDAPSPNFDHVWITIYSIDLDPASGSPVNVFTSTSGLVVDVRSLHDSSGGLFEFLDNAGVPVGTYSGASVILDRNLTVVNHGQLNSIALQFSPANNAAQAGKSQFTFSFAQPFVATNSNPLILDFALANWNVDSSGKVRAFVREGSNNGFDDDRRHERRDVEGMITGLTGSAPNLTFTLNYGDDHRQVQVSTDANTALYNEDGTPNPTLINGEYVDAAGVWKSGAFYASEIRIHNQQHGNGDDKSHLVGAEGVASNLDPVAGTFDLTLKHTVDFVPVQTTIHVTTDPKTRYFMTSGVRTRESYFFGWVKGAAPGSLVDVLGKYDGTNLDAMFMILEPPSGGLGGGPLYQVLLAGDAHDVNQAQGSMWLDIRQWEGIEGRDGERVNVVTNSSTIYRENLNVISEAVWYSKLGRHSLVAVYGPYTAGTITATDISIVTLALDDGGGGGH